MSRGGNVLDSFRALKINAPNYLATGGHNVAVICNPVGCGY